MKKTSHKTILVGIDYSQSSDNALEYAIMLAERGKTSITLFHVYETPVIHTYSGAYFVSYAELQGFNIERLEKYKRKLEIKYPKTHFETMATYTSFKEAAKDLIKRRKIHYVVLGLETKSKFSKFIYGTTGMDIAGKISCPVIIVPQHYKTHRLNKSITALDNSKSIEDRFIEKVKDFSKKFKVKNEFVHVKSEDEFLFITDKKAQQLNKKLNVKRLEAKNFETGINDYRKENNIDLITLFSHSHSALYNLFNESNTKQIAFHSKIPVMSIHE